MAGELGGGYGGPVKAPQQGLPHLGAPAGAVGRVEANVQHGAGGVVHRSKGTRKTQGIGARQVGGDQGNVPGIKGMDQIVRLLNGPQGNGIPGQGLTLPPVGAGFQREVLPRAGEHVGPRAQGDASRLLDDGDVQQGGQSTVGAAQGDGHHAVGGGDVRHAGEAGGVEGAGAGQVEGGRDLRGRQGATVGEGHPAAGDKGPLEAVGRHGGGGAERLLGLKLPVQGKQPLIQQAPQGQVGAVGAGNGVEPGLRVAGQGELGRLWRGGDAGRGGGCGLRLRRRPTGGQTQAQGYRQQGG